MDSKLRMQIQGDYAQVRIILVVLVYLKPLVLRLIKPII